MQYEKLAKQIKDDIKKHLLTHFNEFDETEPVNNLRFRRTVVQRYTYDKSAVRQIIGDEDLLDDFLTIDKPALDSYIKGNLAQLGDLSTQLRESMIPQGKPYEMFRLDKV